MILKINVPKNQSNTIGTGQELINSVKINISLMELIQQNINFLCFLN